MASVQDFLVNNSFKAIGKGNKLAHILSTDQSVSNLTYNSINDKIQPYLTEADTRRKNRRKTTKNTQQQYLIPPPIMHRM